MVAPPCLIWCRKVLVSAMKHCIFPLQLSSLLVQSYKGGGWKMVIDMISPQTAAI